MQRIIITLFVFTACIATAFAVVQYEASNLYKFSYGDQQGNSSFIQILGDLNFLTLSTDYGSVGNSGKIGYIVYNADETVAQRSEALFYKQLQPSNDIVISNLMAGQRVGFFFERSNGRIEENFMFFEREGSAYLQFAKNGVFSGSSEFVRITDAHASAPSGQPLPGVLVTLIVGGGALAGAAGLRHRLRAKDAR